MTTPAHNDTDIIPKPIRGWVWHSTDESIAAEQISVLSLLETLCALGLYGWLAFHFEHQWWLLVSAIAAPILLLRSPKSTETALSLLQHYWEDNEGSILDHSKKRYHINKQERISIRLILLLTGLFMLYALIINIDALFTQLPKKDTPSIIIIILINIVLIAPTFLLLFVDPLNFLDTKISDIYYTTSILLAFITSVNDIIISIAIIIISFSLSSANYHPPFGAFLFV